MPTSFYNSSQMKDILQHIFTNYDNSTNLFNLGFDEPCIAYHELGGLHRMPYNEHHSNSKWYSTSAPTHEQVINWFYEKYGLFLDIQFRVTGQFNEMKGFHFTVIDVKNKLNLTANDYELNGGLDGFTPKGFGKIFDTISETYDEAIKWAINYILTNKQ